jgi:AcrR family transcriptional regulator
VEPQAATLVPLTAPRESAPNARKFETMVEDLSGVFGQTVATCPDSGQIPAARRRSPRKSAAPKVRPGATAPSERIVEVARELFCRDGIHATGIDRVLAAAGVSKMTLYARFGSKDALLAEVLRREGAAQRTALAGGLDAAGPDPAAQLAHAVGALRPWFEGGHYYGCAFMNAAAEHTKGQPTLRALAAEHHSAVLADLRARAGRAGYLEPAMLARQVLLVLDGAIAALMVGGDPAVLDVAERNLAAVLATAPRHQSM